MRNNLKIMLLIIICILLATGLGVLIFVIAYKTNSQFPKFSFTKQTDQLSSSHTLLPHISNQWFSSIESSFPSSPLYAMPLAYEVTPTGLGFSYPKIVKSENSITAQYQPDITIGYDTPFDSSKLLSVSDWTITAELSQHSGKSLSFTIGHGIPSCVLNADESTTIWPVGQFILFDNSSQITSKSIFTDSFAINVNNSMYIIVLPSKTNIDIAKNSIVLKNPRRIFVGLLDKKENYNLFKQNANINIINTQVNPSIDTNKLLTNYQITTDTSDQPLITLYPHQYDFLTSKIQVLGSYNSLRGNLKLVKTSSFTTSLPLIVPGGIYDKLSGDNPDLKAQIIKDTNDALSQKPPESKDYYLGVWFGKISSLLLLVDAYQMNPQKKALLSKLETEFQKSLKNFYYDSEKTSLIPKYPEFGSENLNDHHFHYGYYLRTAAILSNFDLPYLKKIQDNVSEMASDIATLQRDSTKYPFLRNFDIYEGHSWADGYGMTQDGSNQESSSEAINAWYGLYLWAKITNDPDLQKTALYLYNTEVASAQYYWFNSKNIYALPYNHAIASIVWGGKVDFATWFSPDTNMKYGIQLLPFTPASDYLGQLPSFSQYANDYYQNGGSEKKPWGDLFLMWKSYYTPTEALKQKNSITSSQDGNTMSLFLYTLYKNLETQTASLSAVPQAK